MFKSTTIQNPWHDWRNKLFSGASTYYRFWKYVRNMEMNCTLTLTGRWEYFSPNRISLPILLLCKTIVTATIDYFGNCLVQIKYHAPMPKLWLDISQSERHSYRSSLWEEFLNNQINQFLKIYAPSILKIQYTELIENTESYCYDARFYNHTLSERLVLVLVWDILTLSQWSSLIY